MTAEALTHIEKALGHLADAGILLRREAWAARERSRSAEAVQDAEIILESVVAGLETGACEVAGMMGGVS